MRRAEGVSVRGTRSVVVLGVVCAAQFMVVLDVSVVNVALPSIQTTLGFDPVALQWVASGYALVFAGFLLLDGRLADSYGRRRIFLLGPALFAAAFMSCAAEPGWLAEAQQQLGEWLREKDLDVDLSTDIQLETETGPFVCSTTGTRTPEAGERNWWSGRQHGDLDHQPACL